MKILNFKSRKKNNPFAIEWNYYIAKTFLDIDNKELTKFLLSKVPELMKIKPGRDGYTGLGPNNTTARHSKFNILTWESLEIDQLKEGILKAHNDFLRHVKTNDTSTYYMTSPNHLNEPEIHESKNEPGQLTLFQNCIPHYTDKAKGQRITIAFDLSLVKTHDTFIRL